MSLGPDREPTTRQVYVWLEIAAQLAVQPPEAARWRSWWPDRGRGRMGQAAGVAASGVAGRAG